VIAIFLDFDGVLCTARMAKATGERGVIGGLDPVALAFLNRICREYPVKIVISSTWRAGQEAWFFWRLFASAGHHDIRRALHEDWKTPVTGDTRGEEIQLWLDAHPEVSDYLILDDDSDMLEHQMPNLIHTDSLNGMLLEHYRDIEKRLETPAEAAQ